MDVNKHFLFFIMPHIIAFTFIRQDNFTNVPYNFTAQVMRTVCLSKISISDLFGGAINFYYLSSIMSVKSRWSATPLTPLWKYQHSSLPAENSWQNLLINFHWTEVFLDGNNILFLMLVWRMRSHWWSPCGWKVVALKQCSDIYLLRQLLPWSWRQNRLNVMLCSLASSTYPDLLNACVGLTWSFGLACSQPIIFT